jgi:hypothetical protein
VLSCGVGSVICLSGGSGSVETDASGEGSVLVGGIHAAPLVLVMYRKRARQPNSGILCHCFICLCEKRFVSIKLVPRKNAQPSFALSMLASILGKRRVAVNAVYFFPNGVCPRGRVECINPTDACNAKSTEANIFLLSGQLVNVMKI